MAASSGRRDSPPAPALRGESLSETSTVRCTQCDRTADDTRLGKCPICFKRFCDDHQHQMSGRAFCSSQCAQYFFFADPDEGESEDE